MAIPELPPFFNGKFTHDTGHLTTMALSFHDNMFQSLNNLLGLVNISTTSHVDNGTVTLNGLNPPKKSTAEINALAADQNVVNGTIWFNTDINKMQFKTGPSSIQTISSS